MINVTIEADWNPKQYYTLSVKFSLQFDPLLLNSLDKITIQPTIEPDGIYLLPDEYLSIQPKELVNGVCTCVYVHSNVHTLGCIDIFKCVCMFVSVCVHT